MMKGFLFALALLCGALLGTGPAHATCGDGASTCFWIAGGGAANWSATTNWSTSSGGATCTCTPATGDSVVIDGNSGTNGSTINANISLLNFDASASSVLTLTHNAAINLTITGTTFKFGTNLTYTKGNNTSSLVTFTPGAAATVDVTSATKVFAGVTVNGATDSVFRLQDDISVSANTGSSTITLTQGGFNANNRNVTTASFSTSNANTRAVTFGSGTWTFSGGSPWVATTSTNLTNTPGTATIVINTAGVVTFAGGGATGGYPAISWPVAQTAAGGNVISGTNTFAAWTMTAPRNLRISNNQVITAAVSWAGASATPFFMSSTSDGVAVTMTLTNGGTINWAAIKDITFAGTAPTITNSFNLLGNSGATINAPSGGGGHIIGG